MSVVTPVLLALAAAFRESAAGRGGAVRDFVIDPEKLLRRAGLADGDAREQAERDLEAAAKASGGKLGIDRHARTREAQRIRLVAEGGEAWLFGIIGDAGPAERREVVAAGFLEAMEMDVPEGDREAWRSWLERLVHAARAGGSVLPFSREDGVGNRELLRLLAGILTWPHESLIRYASSRLSGDSKTLERLRPKLEAALRAMRGVADAGLDDFGIREVPRSVTFHGPLRWHFPGGLADFSLFSGPVRVSAEDLARGTPELGCSCVLTVENESVFLELVRRNPGVLLIHTSFPGAATRMLVDQLPAPTICYHFGDTDPAGFDILRDLREKTGRPFQPFFMDPRPGGPLLDAAEMRTLDRLRDHPLMADLHPVLNAMHERGTKGEFEQEGIPIDEVVVAMKGWLENI